MRLTRIIHMYDKNDSDDDINSLTRIIHMYDKNDKDDHDIEINKNTTYEWD